jgi:hypothetical protein
MNFAIVSGVRPPTDSKGGRAPKYPFEQMKPEDAFYVPVDPIEPAPTTAMRLRSAAGAWVRRHREAGLRFMVRQTPHPETGKPSIAVYARAALKQPT